MGGIIGVIVGFLAIILFYGTKHPIQFWMSIASTILVFWSWGIMHNFAMASAKKRWDLIRENMVREGRPQEDLNQIDRMPIRMTSIDKNSVPDWITIFNMIVTFIGVVLLVWGIIVRMIK